MSVRKAWLAALLLLPACGDPQAVVDDLLYFQTGRGVAVVRAGASAPTFRAAGGVPSQDWSTVVRADSSADRTEVSAFLPSSATRLWSRDVKGSWRVKVVSDSGTLSALGPSRERYWQYGRRRTSLMVTGNRRAPSTYGLPGNYEPEAFSTDGKSLFLLRYLPARAPDRYQVRRLDLETGRVHDVYTPDAHLQTAMRGTARVQAASTDGRRLYTLYTLDTPVGEKAFVHVLSLDELWAHCIDLPDDFAVAPESAALAVSSKRDRLYVANGATGAIAEIDPDALAVTRAVEVPFGRAAESVAAAGGDALYLASGTRVTKIALDDLTEERAWSLPDLAGGLQLGREERKLYVGVGKRVLVFDVSTGRRIRTLDPPGIAGVGTLGRVGRSVQQVPDKIVCAC